MTGYVYNNTCIWTSAHACVFYILLYYIQCQSLLSYSTLHTSHMTETLLLSAKTCPIILKYIDLINVCFMMQLLWYTMNA